MYKLRANYIQIKAIDTLASSISFSCPVIDGACWLLKIVLVFIIFGI